MRRSIGMFFPPRSLEARIFIICLSVALGVMAASLAALSRSAARTIERNATAYVKDNLIYTGETLDRYVDVAMKTALTVAVNTNVIRRGLRAEVTEPTYDWFAVKRDIEGFLASLISDKDYIRMAAVVSEDGLSYQSGAHILLQDIVDESWFREAWGASGTRILYQAQGRGVLLCRTVYDSGKAVALVIVELDRALMGEFMERASPVEARVFTVTGDGEIVFDNEAGRERPVDREFAASVAARENVSGGYELVDGERAMLISQHSALTELTLFGLIPHHSLITDALNMWGQTLFIALVSLCIAVAASLYFSGAVTKNLKKLKGSMQSVGKENLAARAEVSGSDEIGEIAAVFNQMMDRIQSLVEQVKRDERDKHRLEQEILASQIQPHFIYNAINSIKYVASMRGQSEISAAASSLAELIRSVLGNQSEFITLWEERSYIERYLSIQRFKYSREFSLSWEVDEALWAAPIPKLLLQPIVENALLHGVADLGDGRIQTEGYRENGMIILRVVDNGKGLDKAEIERLLTDGEQGPSGHRRMGLRSVFQRLRLCYGEEARLLIDSLPGVFTSVELRFPERGR